MAGLVAVATAYVIDIAGVALDPSGVLAEPPTNGGINWHRILIRSDDAPELYLALDDVFGGDR